ncbi:MAG: hypothetical protein M3R27_13725, partial [Bacteroidota bacterium]|nr:hypothetical protein [Bacteroidota bacterium]
MYSNIFFESELKTVTPNELIILKLLIVSPGTLTKDTSTTGFGAIFNFSRSGNSVTVDPTGDETPEENIVPELSITQIRLEFTDGPHSGFSIKPLSHVAHTCCFIRHDLLSLLKRKNHDSKTINLLAKNSMIKSKKGGV